MNFSIEISVCYVAKVIILSEKLYKILLIFAKELHLFAFMTTFLSENKQSCINRCYI